jgi:hypothetical protein
MLKVVIYKLKVLIYRLKVVIYMLKVVIYMSRVMHEESSNCAPRVNYYAPREHLQYRLHLQSSQTIILYDCKTFIAQARDVLN